MKLKHAFSTAALVAVLAFVSRAPLYAQTLEEHTNQCALQVQSEHEWQGATTAFAGCVAARAMQQGSDVLVASLNQNGKARFGTGFGITTNMRYAPLGDDEAVGDVDMVMPLMAFTGGAKDAGSDVAAVTNALYLQGGTTIYRDVHGERRYDMRLGFAHRTAIGQARDNIFGLSLMAQENREYGHRRLVSSLDYAGAWGKAALNFFQPDTGWLPARAGYEERALAGREVNVQLNLTSTLGMQAAFGKWEQQDDPGMEKEQGRLGFQWQPHTYLKLGGNRSGIGTNNPETAWRVAVEIPLGATKKAARWLGLGMAGVGNVSTADLWRPVDNIDRIEVAERKHQPQLGVQSGEATGDVQVRFVQDSTATGGEFGIEVTLVQPVTVDTTVIVRLLPGEGEHPAVAGVDYVDEPIEVSIHAGQITGTAVARLLSNPELTVTRTISAVGILL